MDSENIVRYRIRLNVNNPQHVKVNRILKDLNSEVYRSKNQFIIDAIEYFIDHFGEDRFLQHEQEECNAYIAMKDLEKIKKELFERAMTEARNEVIRVLGGVMSGMQPVQMVRETRDEKERNSEEDNDILAGLASQWMEGQGD